MDEPHVTPEPNKAPVPPPPDYYNDRDYGRPAFGRGAFEKDREHLNLLAIFYFVFCGLECFGVLGSFVYIGLGIVMVTGGAGTGPQGPPPGMGFFFLGIGVFLLVLSVAFATCLGMTGYYLRKRKRRTFCFVIACIACLSVPLGTLLGIFTILVLQRESVKELFLHGDQPAEREGDENQRA